MKKKSLQGKIREFGKMGKIREKSGNFTNTYFNDVRQRFYQVPTLQDLFKTVKPEVILDFLKAAALYGLL